MKKLIVVLSLILMSSLIGCSPNLETPVENLRETVVESARETAVEKARETSVKSDLRTFMLASEIFFNEGHITDNETIDKLNRLLDTIIEVTEITRRENTEGPYHGVSNLKDPWGNHYELTANNNKIMVRSHGKDNDGEKYEYLAIIKTENDKVTSYTSGLSNDIGEPKNIVSDISDLTINKVGVDKQETRTNEQPIVKEPEVVRQELVIIKVTDKKNIPMNYEEWRFSSRVEFELKVTNNTTKEIQGIQGTLMINNLFDDKIMGSGLEIVGQPIKPGETVVDKGKGIDINEYMDNHVELYNTEYKDLKFKFELEKIVYTDGTMQEL